MTSSKQARNLEVAAAVFIMKIRCKVKVVAMSDFQGKKDKGHISNMLHLSGIFIS